MVKRLEVRLKRHIMQTKKGPKKKKSASIEEMVESEQYAFMTNKWSRTVVQPLLIALIIAAFFTAVATVIDVVFQVKLHRALAPLLFLIALEGVYTTIWMNHPDRRQLNRLAYRAAEFLVFVLMVRLFTWYRADNMPTLAQLPDFLKYPLLLFNDAYFVIAVVLLFLTWLRAITACEAFNRLTIDYAEVYYFTLPRSEQEPGMKPGFSNRMEIVTGLFNQWIWGAIFLAACTAVTAIDPQTLPSVDSLLAVRHLDLPAATVWSLLIYFVGGLLLLSQARLAALNARWLHEGASKSPQIERSWHRTTTWLLLIIAIIALFLPLGSTFAIGRVLQIVANFVVQLFVFVSYLILGLFSLFFSRTESSSPPPATAPPPTQLPVTPAPTPLPRVTLPPNETAQMFVSSAFWAVTIVMTAVAISFFLRDRGVRLNLTLIAGIGRGFMAWLRGLWQDVSEAAGDAAQAVRQRWQTAVKPDDTSSNAPPWRFIRLNALSPRDQIRYFYLSTVKRAGEQGAPRAQDETPLEFAQDLKTNWPEAEDEIEELTDAFLRARYSRENIEKEDVNPVKQQWRQVKNRLRRSRSP